MKQFFHYFVDPLAPTESSQVIIGLIAAGILFLSCLIVSWIAQSRRKSAIHPLAASLAPIGQLGGLLWLLFFFLRYEGLAPFQYRIWAYSVWVIVLVWGVIRVRRYKREKPTFGREVVLRDRYEQYLPQPKQSKRK